MNNPADTIMGIMTAIIFIGIFLVFFVGGPVLAIILFNKSPARKAMSIIATQNQMLATLAVGDKVMLTTGKSGTVSNITGHELDIEFEDGNTFTVNRNLVLAKQEPVRH